MASSLPVRIAMSNDVHKGTNGTMAGGPSSSQQQQQPIPPPAASASLPKILSETTASTWVAIGSLAESLGDLEKALASYDAALRHTPNNPEVLTRLANIYRSKDVFFKAAELYEQALNYHPENGETWGLLGHCYLMLDDLQRAYAAYQRALYYLENPNVPKLWHGIGILYDRYGSLEYAEEAFVRVLELDPNFEKSNEIYFRLGIIYKHQGKLKSALECFQYILNNPPHPLTQPDVWFQIGSVLEQQKDWNGAKEAYEKVLQVNPQHAKVLQQLGCLYSQAEPASPGQPGAGGLGSQPFKQDLNIALKYLLQSLEIDQSDAHSWYYLGRVHMIRGDFNAAYEAFQQAVNRDSRNPTFWCSIGVLYYQISQYRDALDAYTRAIRLNPYISEVWYDLGTLYETCNNQISDALDAYRQAERLDPGNPHIKARLEQLIKYQQEGNGLTPQPPPVSQQPRLPQGIILESTEMQQPNGQPQQPQQQQQQQQLHPSQLMQGPPHQQYPPLHLSQLLPVNGLQPPMLQANQQRDFQPSQVLGQPPQGPQGSRPTQQAPPLPPALLHQPSLGQPSSVAYVPSSTLGKPSLGSSSQHNSATQASEASAPISLPPPNIQSHKVLGPSAPQPILNPPSSNGLKHELEDKRDHKVIKKATLKMIKSSSSSSSSSSSTTGKNNSNNSGASSSSNRDSPVAEEKDHRADESDKPVKNGKQTKLKSTTVAHSPPKADEKETDEGEEEPSKQNSEPVEPPLRKVEEDENYDDE